MSVRRLAVPARSRPLRSVASSRIEHRHTFACFGGECTVIVADARRPADAAAAAAMAKRALLHWHQRFSRFEPESELSRLNRDSRDKVPVSPLMRRLVAAALEAARQTGGLVDPTLGSAIERAGYRGHFDGNGIPREAFLSQAPPPTPAGSDPGDRWRRIATDSRVSAVVRPPGTVLDLGGIAKGVFADELVGLLEGFEAFALDCAGDIRWGGRAGVMRDMQVADPFDGSILHTYKLSSGAIATSGIGRRSWRRPDGRPAHHLLDPRTGEPAFTGVVQATALAPTTAEAEALAKAAVLSGPERAGRWLPHGGVVVRDDGSYAVTDPAAGTRAQVCTSAHGTTTASSCGESRATT